MVTGWVAVEDVRAVSDGLVLMCEAHGKRFGVPLNQIAPQSQVHRPGDYGTLVIHREFALQAGFATDG